MRKLVLAIFVALTSIASAEERSPLDAPIPSFRLPATLPACGMNTAVARLRRAATISIGFDMEWECFGSVPTLPRDGK